MLKLRQVEVLQGQGWSVSKAVRQIGVTVHTYYRWRKERAMSDEPCPAVVRGQWQVRDDGNVVAVSNRNLPLRDSENDPDPIIRPLE